MDKEELKALIRKKKGTLKEYAKELGMTYMWLHNTIRAITGETKTIIKESTANKVLEPLGLEAVAKYTIEIRKKGE